MVSDILPKEIGNAKLLGNFSEDPEGWHEARATRIGGSEVGAIVGESKYESPYSLWAKKTGRIESTQVDNDFMYWGRALEPVIIDRFAEKNPQLDIYRDVGTWVHKDEDWRLANPDAIIAGDRGYGILEIKTARFADDWKDGVPKYYMTQVQWYLNTFGLDYAVIACLFSGSNYQEFWFDADPSWQAHDLDIVRNFRDNYLLADKKPDFDGAESTYEAVREEYTYIEESEVEIGQLGLDWDNAKTAVEETKAHQNKFAAEILDLMGEAKYATVFGEVFLVRQSRGGVKPFLVKKRGA